MSILRSYFSKNNTITSNSYVNTARNPVMELNFGSSNYLYPNFGFTRILFDLDLVLLKENVASNQISFDCNTGMTHTLKMINTSTFDEELINTSMSNSRKRATSFDLVLFRIPKTSGDTGDNQLWDEGVGYDYENFNINNPTNFGGTGPLTYIDPRSYSTRPSNWFQTTTIREWSEPGVYNNKNEGLVNFSGLTIISRQHFEIGNENLEMDMTSEINSILDGSLTGVTGWGIAFVPEIENISGLTDSYSVAFFSKYTQTFYQPYLETNYDDLVTDDRNQFLKNQTNKLYLYVYQNGDFTNLDNLPTVQIQDRNGTVVPGLLSLPTCQISKGIYEVTIPNSFTSYPTPCTFYDIWKDISINGESIPDIQNQFILQKYSSGIQIGSTSKEPQKFGFDFYGILQNEKILTSDIRKIGITIKKAYTGQQMLLDVSAFYRVYVKEGTTEVEVQEWTPVNRSSNEYYFIFDMRDKIPNQYFVDIQVNSSGEKDTYKKQLTFYIVNQK